MKVSKNAAANARRIFGLCQTGGRLDTAKLTAAIKLLVDSKARDYLAILGALHRLVRLDENRRRVVVESATPLDDASRGRVAAGLARTYGPGLEVSSQITPELIGGLRVRVGDDVLDASVKGRLDRFAAAVG